MCTMTITLSNPRNTPAGLARDTNSTRRLQHGTYQVHHQAQDECLPHSCPHATVHLDTAAPDA
jgi:hypothetical protein